ncbi:MAG: LysR family transcriptional regulator [Sphingomonas adhaesiva]|uniref:LysR family transcriptional regulator n=1 Tax=Sphingomonas adhaesiva TaxID=28212 RepID=UPI002FFD0DA2
MKLKSRIDLNLLAVFDAIFTRASVTQAARHLHLTQSAISHALNRLRREFDDPLFVRSGNALVPTALARALAQPVQQALRGIDVALASALQFDPATSTRLFRIGLRPTAEAHLFATLVRRIARAAPHVRLASLNFRRSELARTLAAGGLDVALDIPGEHSATLRTDTLAAEELIVIARRDHPRVRGAIDLPAYLALDHVIASPRPSGGGTEDEALAALGEERRIRIRCQHIGTAWRIVAGTDMLLTLSRSHAAGAGDPAAIQILPLPFHVAPRPRQLLWHEAVERDPGVSWLRAMIHDAVMNRLHEEDAPSSFSE